MTGRRRIVVLRGTAANPWDLRPWEDLPADRFDVEVLVAANNLYPTDALRQVRVLRVQTLGARVQRLPAPARTLVTRGLGERYLGLADHLRGADVVHAAELGYWFSDQAARLRDELGFRLALTVWETLPFRDAYRNVRTRPYRRRVLAATDLFLAATDRAAAALRLEGAPPHRIRVAPPGVDLDAFAAGRQATPPADGAHLLLSVGRLVWEKGHQDLLRALAHLRAAGHRDVRALIVGAGPEERRLRGVIADLGLQEVVELRSTVPHAELPGIYAQASCLVLGSIPTWSWEEQFGMVLAEAMAAHLPVVAARSGAIGEVVGDDAERFDPGDWLGLAGVLASGPLARPPGTRHAPDPARLERYSSAAAARRLAEAYDELLAGR